MKRAVRHLFLLSFAGYFSVVIAALPVSSADLAEIELIIFPQQVVGQSLLTKARIILLDETGSLLTDYDLAANPIQLEPSSGQLVPDSLDDPALFGAGVIDFLPANVQYLGSTGVISITAVRDTVASTPVMVTFSGYDILDVFDLAGNEIEKVYSGLLTTVKVVVQNNGDLTAHKSPTLKTYFRSGGGSVKSYLTPRAGGLTDTIVIDLPTDNLTAGNDSLVLTLESDYLIEGTSYAAVDSLIVPVTVLIPAVFDLVAGSLLPDSVYAGEEFDISFRVATSDFLGPIDSTCVTVRLYSDTSQPALATIYEGTPSPESFVNDTITYGGLAALIDTAAGLLPGWYPLRLDYCLVSGEEVYALNLLYPDSLLVASAAVLSYVDGSLEPVKVPIGREASFNFDIFLESAQVLEVDLTNASFTVTGSDFSTTAGLLVPSGNLEQDTNTITTDSIFIPANQLGKNLILSASFPYRQVGVANYLTFTTDFNGETVLVEDLPMAQITLVQSVLPNKPRVNTLQPFRINCKVANLSNATIDPFLLRMTSDGASTFEPDLQVDSISAYEIMEVFFEPVAAAEPNPEEVFQVNIISEDLAQLPPIDNTSTVVIERPASLRLTRTMLGAETGFVDHGAAFSMLVTITNEGDAEVSPGVFRLTSNGIDLGVSDPLIDTVEVGSPYSVSFLAPNFDTTINLDFTLIERPIDLNDTLVADIDDTAFDMTITVTSLEAELLVESEIVTSNLVLPGSEQDLFNLEFTNRGTSAFAETRVDSISLKFIGANRLPIHAGSVIDADRSGLYDDGVKVGTVCAVEDRLVLLFPDPEFILQAGAHCSVVFHAAMQRGATREFGITLDNNDVNAVFTSGPRAGQPVMVESATGSSSVFSESFTPVSDVSAQGSFMIRQNPFDPTDSPAEFRFILPEPGAVEFRILSLIGEEVFCRVYAEGELAPVSGDQFVECLWDGRNDKGNMVFNGVYIAMITIVKSGDQALLKVAVVK